MSRAAELQLALEAVRSACRITRALQSEIATSKQAVEKSDRSPVTVADFAAQAIVGHRLGTAFVGEESAAALESDAELRAQVLRAARREEPDWTEDTLVDAIRLGEGEASASFWTLDPIDGTKGFLRDAQYCVSLALLEDGAPVLGVLGCPRLGPEAVEGEGALLFALAGEGAHLSELDGASNPRSVRARAWQPGDPVRTAESAEAAHTNHALAPRLLERAGLRTSEPLRLDSQVKYAVVARGDADLFLRRPKPGYREKIWDHAAGALVAIEAGCRVSDFDGQPLRYEGTRLAPHRGIIAAPAALHAELLPHFEERD